MVNLNLRDDIYPEYPIMEGFKINHRVKNMFEQWREDRQEDLIKAFYNDMQETDNF